MGITDKKDTRPFTQTELKDRDLIIKMLKFEDTLINDEKFGQEIYRNELNGKGTSLEPQFIIQRTVLDHFGFDTSDDSLTTYREIFRTYYKSPFEYDKEVLDSVTYMRENRCVYYKTPEIKVGDKIPDVKIYKQDGKTQVMLHQDILGELKTPALIMAFSTS
jgi:hypothetical protein